ncbi:hypothetical protein G7062_04265 [Erysipelothrix sp. HDW6C]|uniref:hypothetical protein n=1 Tax=Erysipelothrix sp. HDW6C TaxID=2714930 RepID=UPI00140A2EAB|nr:hypothetical protein [Erysipelothrix sp. HDW6C]QIK69557.1 hypothetical protein G7062_04265 [Erysipelothrix sp. HDW6C]
MSNRFKDDQKKEQITTDFDGFESANNAKLNVFLHLAHHLKNREGSQHCKSEQSELRLEDREALLCKFLTYDAETYFEMIVELIKSDTPCTNHQNQPLMNLIEGLLHCFMQAYDIESFSITLLLAMYLNPKAECIKESMQFIHYQKREEGLFGYLNPLNRDYHSIDTYHNFIEPTSAYFLTLLKLNQSFLRNTNEVCKRRSHDNR